MAEQHRPRSRSKGGGELATSGDVQDAVRVACECLENVISHKPEGASAVRRTEEGWCVVVDVLEVARIPDTTSLLATYEVQLSDVGELLEYRRVRRYRRGAADECVPIG